jgi:hypothetical protein
MLEHNTVFVLGAAFSAEMDLPLGDGLKKDIIRILPNGQDGGGDRLLRELIESQGNPLWQDASALLKAALPYAASIDNLVEHHQNDAAVVTVAKWAIARAISLRETICPLGPEYSPRKTGHLESTNLPFTGYHALFRLIVAGVPKNQLQVAFSRLKVITFNYDRTLEVFLARAVAAHSGLAIAEAESVVNQATVFHAYGSLDTTAQIPANRRGFAPLDHRDQIKVLSEGLRTFSEKIRSGEDQGLREEMREADRVVFLGCAFHPQNLRLIRSRGFKAGEVYGTVYVPAPTDPFGHATPSLAEFSATSIDALTKELIEWRDPLAQTGLSAATCYLRPMTNSQLIAHFGMRWCE